MILTRHLWMHHSSNDCVFGGIADCLDQKRVKIF